MNPVVGMICRILNFPFIVAMLLIAACAHAIVWTIDPKYDHEASLRAFYDWLRFLDEWIMKKKGGVA